MPIACLYPKKVAQSRLLFALSFLGMVVCSAEKSWAQESVPELGARTPGEGQIQGTDGPPKASSGNISATALATATATAASSAPSASSTAAAPAAPAMGAPRVTLSVLAPRGVLSYKVVKLFEDQHNVNVRVEFVSNSSEYETRLRASPFGWDLVVANQQRINKLYFSRLVRALPNVLGKGEENSHARTGLATELQNVSLPLLIDPLVIYWSQEVVKNNVMLGSWSTLSDFVAHPLLRNRIDLPENVQAQFIVAGVKANYFLQKDDEALRQALSWLKVVRAQAKNQGLPRSQRLLSKKVVAGGAWLSEVLQLKNVAKNVSYAVPKEGTVFERIVVAAAAESTNEKLAEQLMQHMQKHRAGLANRTGYLSVLAAEPSSFSMENWRYIEEVLPLEKSALAALEKIGN